MNGVLENIWSVERGYSNVQIKRELPKSVFGLFLLHAHISW